MYQTVKTERMFVYSTGSCFPCQSLLVTSTFVLYQGLFVLRILHKIKSCIQNITAECKVLDEERMSPEGKRLHGKNLGSEIREGCSVSFRVK